MNHHHLFERLRRLIWPILLLHVLSVTLPIVSTLSPLSRNEKTPIPETKRTEGSSSTSIKDRLSQNVDSIRSPKIYDELEPRNALPASSRVCLDFSWSVSKGKAAIGATEEYDDGDYTDVSHKSRPFPTRKRLVLKRRNGIDLYGREILHEDTDAETATMSIFDSVTRVEGFADRLLWDATLVIEPDRECQIREGPPPLSIPESLSSCFVAMNRFEVKKDCRFLFEERWARRESKLSHQPGFVGFSLLRKAVQTPTTTATTTTASSYTDRFNYSTCTIWDSIEAWERWRNGGGKSSHDASKREGSSRSRVPVSEWLKGPSAPIFWDGTVQTPVSTLFGQT